MLPEVKDYIIVDVETCPIRLDGYAQLSDAEKSKLINPIDSRIVAIGVRHNEVDQIFCDSSEIQMLEGFWNAYRNLAPAQSLVPLVGFNIKDFDLPFLLARSFINFVKIRPFLISEVIDLREKLCAYSHTTRARGRLKEYGALMGIEDIGINGSHIADLCIQNNMDEIVRYLKHDLLITDRMFQRARDTNILYVDRW
jgi:uncharacterized protein YprB with RNaseH-like and TPR domain